MGVNHLFGIGQICLYTDPQKTHQFIEAFLEPLSITWWKPPIWGVFFFKNLKKTYFVEVNKTVVMYDTYIIFEKNFGAMLFAIKISQNINAFWSLEA